MFFFKSYFFLKKENDNLENDNFELLSFLISFQQTIESEEEFVAIANSDISQLCGEIVLLWNAFLNTFAENPAVSAHLGRSHHLQRVKRFSEGFFLLENPRGKALDACDANYQVRSSTDFG